ncbi:MAG: YfhO family protein [Magnetococcus sp. WYHC-3]
MQVFFKWLGRARWLPVVLLVLCVLAPYSRVVTGRAVLIPDDIFVSDLADGEFPMCVEAGRLLRAGEAPVWTSRILTGMPLMVNPLTLPLFAGLPPALALGLFLGLLLAVAAVGGYLLARQLGASCEGGFLSGFAFAWSGFFVCQLRHLGVLGVVAFFPLALFCLERAATGGAPDRAGALAMPARQRMKWLAGFAALFGMQCLSGFPQSVYIASLVYGALVAVRLLWLLTPDERGLSWASRLPPAMTLAWGALAAVAIGTLIGMAVLLPLHELGALSDRSGGGTYEWATHYNYWPRNFLTFFLPYINGDISNLTYQGKSIFWEDYGYVGLLTMLLAMLVVVARVRRFAVAFWALVALVAYGLVIGREAPFYRVAFQVLPGFDVFRFPTRCLFVVELALAVLGGLGLTLVQDFLARRVHPARAWSRWLPGVVGTCLAAVVAGDLVWHNRRQNPEVDSAMWLTPTSSVRLIQQDGSGGRIFTPGSATLHMAVFHAAGGWGGDLSPYVRHREFLQPDSNLLHGLAALDGYTGIAPSCCVSLFGDHNREGLFNHFYGFDANGLRVSPLLLDWMEAVAARWLILPVRVSSERLQHVGSAPPAEVYRLRQALPRARIITRARLVNGLDELASLVAEGAFDPRREVALQDSAAADMVASLGRGGPADAAPGEARIVKERNTEIVIEAQTPCTALLLLADTYYPGWGATVDGRPVPIMQANLAHRAVLLPPGVHRVVFAYRPSSVTRGLLLTGIGLLLLLLGVVASRRMSGL